jgi:hypothetical protein
MRPLLTLLLFVLSAGLSAAAQQATILQVPGSREFCRISETGTSVLPSGRYVTPAGQLVRITHDPFGLALSPDGRTAVTLHNGAFTRLDLASLAAVRVPSYDKKIASPFSKGSFLGVAFSTDSKKVYLSGGLRPANLPALGFHLPQRSVRRAAVHRQLHVGPGGE